MLHISKNELICSFLEDFTAWQFAFETNWPLGVNNNEKKEPIHYLNILKLHNQYDFK